MRLVETPWPDRAIVIADLVSPEDWFTGEELSIASAFPREKRREEWLLSRAAAKQLAVHLGICEDPRTCMVERPRLTVEGRKDEWFVSLTHSAPFAGAAIAGEPVGLDVQVVRELSEAAAHLFLTEEEASQMRASTVSERLLHFWCAKEAAWKKRGGEVATLKQVPISLVSESASGIVFDGIESVRIGELIVAITL